VGNGLWATKRIDQKDKQCRFIFTAAFDHIYILSYGVPIILTTGMWKHTRMTRNMILILRIVFLREKKTKKTVFN